MNSFLATVTPSQIKVSLFFAALLWLFAAVDGNFYLMILLPWIVFIVATCWKTANDGAAIFEEKPLDEARGKEAKVAEEKKEAPAAANETVA